MLERYESLTEWSKRLHGHATVLPAAAWIQENGVDTPSPPEVDRGLGGADRQRVIEALVKLAEIGAMRELPRTGASNATRYFERIDSSYWSFLEDYLAETGFETPASGSAAP